MSRVKLHTIVVGEFQVNCVIAWDDAARAVVFDPGADADLIADFLGSNRLTVSAYMLTHGHVDHLSALADLHGEFPAPVGMAAADASWAFSPANALPPFYPAPRFASAIDRHPGDGDTWTDGGLVYSVIETPGHTPGSVCYHFQSDGILLCGDTLFAGSAGRTDLPRGNSRALTASLHRLAGLPESVRIVPGHGPESTIGHEKRTNFFMRNPLRV